MCSSGWARVAMERQAKRVSTDVGEEALMADAAPVDFIVLPRSAYVINVLSASAKAATPKARPRDPVPFGKDHTTYQHDCSTACDR